MRLSEPFLQLPIRFDAAALASDMEALPTTAWVPHPEGFRGNEAVRLVTTMGQETDDVTVPMAPTGNLLSCPYLMKVMAAIGAVWGRSRLMRLAPGSVVPPHIDTHFYWRRHMRLHIPIVTTPDVSFSCRGETVHMAAGECWLFDTFSNHYVRNGGTTSRVHLVLDTVGGEGLWDLIEQARQGGTSARLIAPDMNGPAPLAFERLAGDCVMSPWEVRCHVVFIQEHAVPDPRLAAILRRLDRFVAAWTATWAQYGGSDDGIKNYRRIVAAMNAELSVMDAAGVRLNNRTPIVEQIGGLLFAALDPQVAAAQMRPIESVQPGLKTARAPAL
jgi:hypothetical protein